MLLWLFNLPQLLINLQDFLLQGSQVLLLMLHYLLHLLGFQSGSLLQFHIFLLVFYQRFCQYINFMDHSLFLQFIDIATALCAIQSLILLSDIHQQSLHQSALALLIQVIITILNLWFLYWFFCTWSCSFRSVLYGAGMVVMGVRVGMQMGMTSRLRRHLLLYRLWPVIPKYTWFVFMMWFLSFCIAFSRWFT